MGGRDSEGRSDEGGERWDDGEICQKLKGKQCALL